jgi:hypothetical protein
VRIAGVRLVFDSNLSNEKRMPCAYPQKGNVSRLPSSLVRQYRLEVLEANGQWRVAYREKENIQRLVHAPLDVTTSALRLVPETTWGDATARVFAFEPLTHFAPKRPVPPDGLPFAEARARISPADLAPPEGAEAGGKGHGA